jgi:outer membrane protein TolC
MLSASQQTLMSMELKFKNGIVKKIDVDKIRVSYNNTRSQVEQTVLNLKQALNNLKYLMGLPMGNDISLSDSLSEGVWEQPDETIQKDDVVEHRIDYQMLKTNVAAQNLNKQNQMAAYFPTLTFSANYNYQAMRTRFDIFEKGKEWYKNSSIGLNLSIPIFSGFKRVSKVSEAQLGIEVAKENLKLSAQAIQLEISNYGVQYSTALDNIQNEKDNLSLAENVLKNIRLEFSQGTGSSIDLIQAESAFRETQNNYYTKLLTLYLAKLDLEKSQGTLTQFINKLR